VRTIGDALNEKHISWAYYGGAFNAAVNLANGSTNPLDAIGVAYCQICNPFQYATSIMGNPAQRTAHIKDVTDLFAALANGTLPAVSFVKPDGLLDGHPANSKLDLFEAMVKNILNRLHAPSLSSGLRLPYSSSSTRAAAIGTLDISSHSISSATGCASRS
jgi:phospholipase C